MRATRTTPLNPRPTQPPTATTAQGQHASLAGTGLGTTANLHMLCQNSQTPLVWLAERGLPPVLYARWPFLFYVTGISVRTNALHSAKSTQNWPFTLKTSHEICKRFKCFTICTMDCCYGIAHILPGSYNVYNVYLYNMYNIRRIKSPKLNGVRVVFQLSLTNPLKPGVESRTKM